MGNTLQSSVVKPECRTIKDINIICYNIRNTLLFNTLSSENIYLFILFSVKV